MTISSVAGCNPRRALKVLRFENNSIDPRGLVVIASSYQRLTSDSDGGYDLVKAAQDEDGVVARYGTGLWPSADMRGSRSALT